jgi:hypothetical protein
MADRQRVRVGRDVTYRPTDAEAATGNGEVDDEWHATISRVNADGTVNLSVLEADGGFIALTDIAQGQVKGTFDVLTTES